MARMGNGRGRMAGYGPISTPRLTVQASGYVDLTASGAYLLSRSGGSTDVPIRTDALANTGLYFDANNLYLVVNGTVRQQWSQFNSTQLYAQPSLNGGGFLYSATAKSSSFDISATENSYKVTAALTATCPAVDSASRTWLIYAPSGFATHNVTIARNATPGTDTVNGAASVVLSTGRLAVVQSLASSGQIVVGSF